MRLTEVFTLAEIEQKYGLKTERIKAYLNRGAKDWVKNKDYKKSGRVWLVTREAVENKFGIDLVADDELFI